MTLRRVPSPPAQFTPKVEPEIEVIDVTQLNVALDIGPGLTFHLGKDDLWAKSEDGKTLLVKEGNREFEIDRSRIIYLEKHPHQLKKVRVQP